MDSSDIQTFEFQPEHDGSLSLETAVFQALGAASVCWDPMESNGIFQSERAKAIGEALLEKIKFNKAVDKLQVDLIDPNSIIDIGPECFTNGEVISYKGQNYYRACDTLVTGYEHGAASYCVKRIGHPGNIHEDYDGNLKENVD